ncbi:hypothetical protein BCR42DRAFT_421278 [Absidia repens]|uniref:Uncharacterized protein n=1 Tax=Absidia repens TaxID=90262 RepID=A0A1X2I8A8_9FUNG|nr:hypothetical protein BCR42DRAFT_421278 [Absidia repens]
MKSLSTDSYTKDTREEEQIIDKKQPSTSEPLSTGVDSTGSSVDQKSLPPPPPVLFVTPPSKTMAEILPEKKRKSIRRRRCLLGWLCVIFTVLLAALFIFVIYGIPASHCCSCLIAYDKCDNLANSTTAHNTCLDGFNTCSASSIYIFFSCSDRLYNRNMSCWIQYFND